MPSYQLFAARDGDVFRASMSHPNLEAAEKWAASRIVEEFGLERYDFSEFYELVAETDGVLLEQQQCDRIEKAALEWSLGQLTMLSWLKRETGAELQESLRAYSAGLLKLIEALQNR